MKSTRNAAESHNASILTSKTCAIVCRSQDNSKALSAAIDYYRKVPLPIYSSIPNSVSYLFAFLSPATPLKPSLSFSLSFIRFSTSVLSFASDLVWFSKNYQSPIERGNQRDRDRERAQARASSGKTKQPKNDGLTPEQRRERDAKALQEKAAKKAAQAAGGNNAGGLGKKK
ncbi:hypothetical protein K1719_040366 [Acacia pycnantha]|nr:hypothetical protein K1719_040366 [Acacia pycnantha]